MVLDDEGAGVGALEQEARRAQQTAVAGMDGNGKKCGSFLLSSAERKLEKRLYGILNAMKYRVSNGNAESLNSKISESPQVQQTPQNHLR